jgi:hypothetical protein
MLRLTIQKSLLFLFLVFSTAAFAQNKPYRILTSGKDITIKSTKTIKEVLVWTTTGYRIVENRSVNNSSFSFQVKVPAKYVFVMIHFEGSKPYTEKLGL